MRCTIFTFYGAVPEIIDKMLFCSPYLHCKKHSGVWYMPFQLCSGVTGDFKYPECVTKQITTAGNSRTNRKIPELLPPTGVTEWLLQCLNAPLQNPVFTFNSHTVQSRCQGVPFPTVCHWLQYTIPLGTEQGKAEQDRKPLLCWGDSNTFFRQKEWKWWISFHLKKLVLWPISWLPFANRKVNPQLIFSIGISDIVCTRRGEVES